MKSIYKGIKIAGLATAVSSNWESLEERVEKYWTEDGFKVEKFKKTTGIMGRYIANEYQTTADFCYTAAERIIKEFSIKREEIGILVFVTQTPDYNVPATACVLQYRLGLSEDCIAFDVNQGCAGFVYGLNTVAALLRNSKCNKALLLCGDTSAKSVITKGKEGYAYDASLFLFGDAGTAALLEKNDEKEPLVFETYTDGEGFRVIIDSGNRWRHPYDKIKPIMDDIAVFNFAITKVPDMLNRYMLEQNKTPNDYDGLVLHQANLFIMKQIAKKTGFPMDKVLISIDVFANTSSASIPSAIVKEYGNINSGDIVRLLICGFGVGLSWAVVEFEVSVNDILPLVYTDDYFDDKLSEE